MNKAFVNFIWKDYPSTETALEAERLNKINAGLSEIDDRVIVLDTSKLDKTTAYTMVKDVKFDESTGIFTIVKLNGSEVKIDTKLEKLIVNFKFNEETQKIEITLDDETKQEIDLSAFVVVTEFFDSDTIRAEIDGNNVKFHIVSGSVTSEMLEPNYLANVTEKADTATQKAAEAKASATAASASEKNAATSATAAASSEKVAVTSATNAKTSETNAASSATSAASSASTASTKATNAATSATNASNSATAAKTSETNAKASETNAKTSETNASKSASEAATAVSKMGGTVEITEGDPQKENTVLTINPSSSEVNLYTAEEVDEKFTAVSKTISEIKSLLVDGNEVEY